MKINLFFFNSDIVRKIDQSEFEGFEYINPLLMSAEECVWSSFSNCIFACVAIYCMNKPVTSLDTVNHFIFLTYKKSIQYLLLLAVRVNYYI